MFSTLVNAWKIKDIRTKMLYTMLLIVIYRLGSFIPVPGVNAAAIANFANEYDMLGFLNLLSGGAFGDFSIFAMGISPYITGSIIIQLLTIAIPSLERLSKEEDGRVKIERITRYTGIGLALVQSIGIVAGLQNSTYGGNVLTSTDNLFLTYATIGLVCTAGTAFLVWIGERITEKGIGNGVSFIIFASICARVPTYVLQIFKNVFVTGQMRWWILPILLVFVLVIVTGVTFIDRSERRIPIQYAKRVVGRKMYGGQSTHIPLKANANGVMPLIFAMTLMQVPAMIGQFWLLQVLCQVHERKLRVLVWTLSVLCHLLAADNRVCLLLHHDILQSCGNKQEPAAERRLYTGHPSRQAHRRVFEEDIQPPYDIWRILPYGTGNTPNRCAWRVRPHFGIRTYQHTDNGQRCA